MNMNARRRELLASLAQYDDGTGTLGVIVDNALGYDPDVSVERVRAIVVESIKDAEIEASRERKTDKQLNAEIRQAVKLGHADTTTQTAERCNTCTRPVNSPFRRYDKGKVTEGCIDAAHTGHLYGESLRWHMRPIAKKMRSDAAKRLRELVKGRPSGTKA